ncbi:DUF262 domain-containing protein [Chryseobacterium arthrosphaerae]|uniref:DUF262 domain-containing protein n=1 Tax=Chryseobacterium TaxID=59732 RepID=UPI0008106B3E|nr:MULTISPECIES: DUF262 domain-containing HNH endonuclease family protein [Chryseobacterium]OCK51069.1 hypothetical protein BA768_18380 [Chryseobacterium sp. CBo1]UEQ78065.1 DUF262 domain-containing protein [Chryseobacterium arthrosphaerae]VXC32821.1 conserved hypothetical protein [Chryseobacterium sp. 8AT]
MGSKINIKDYFEKGVFLIPEYQRGYKWSIKDSTTNESSLVHFIKSLKNAYENEVKEYFIEAVTIVEEDTKIILVDGQQRTTSLFLLFSFLDDKDFIEDKLIYDVRIDSHEWLKNDLPDYKNGSNADDSQDIYYFKEAISQIKNIFNDTLIRSDFLAYLKEKVFLLYNIIPKEKAVNTFIALNGLKAIMKDEELIKSDLLIKSSRIQINSDQDKEHQLGIEWKINEDRGRLARNWDKWLYWWNQNEVKEYFGTGNHHPLYYLLITYWNINDENKKSKDFSFDNFKSQFISDGISAKKHFEGLRKLQKTFEDLYNHPLNHNFLGLILKTSNSKESSLRYFLDIKNTNKIKLEEYSKWSLIGATHLEIINNTTEKINGSETEEHISIKKRKAKEVIDLVNEKFVYWNENDADFKDSRKEYAFRFLLLLNILEDNKLKRKFDFSIWGSRSLEHIFPKSKGNILDFNRDNYIEGSIHCIGNLVLLYGRDNSAFGAKDFSEKKNTYFNSSITFSSRNLLHTISVFSKSDWTEKEILSNKKSIISYLNSYYGIN